MPKTPPLGYVKCPDCDFDNCEIKPSKNGLLYRWCPECNLQTFTRNAQQSDRLKAKMRGVASPYVEKKPVAEPPKKVEPEKKAEPTPEPKKNNFSLGDL